MKHASMFMTLKLAAITMGTSFLSVAGKSKNKTKVVFFLVRVLYTGIPHLALLTGSRKAEP
jgi:hypothetical protein